MHGYRAFRHGISSLPPRRSLLTLLCTLLADGARNSRGRVHQLPRLSPPATASLEVDQICPDSPLRERHSNRPRYRDHRYRDLMHRVLPRFVLCVFSQSCLKARLHLLLMPCCWISFIDISIKPRGGIYFILIFIQGEEMVISGKVFEEFLLLENLSISCRFSLFVIKEIILLKLNTSRDYNCNSSFSITIEMMYKAVHWTKGSIIINVPGYAS